MTGFLSFISVSATLASVFMLASPIITVNNLRKAHSIGVMTITFFCAQYVNCCVWAMYGIQMSAAPVIICNALGGAIATYCLLTFLTIARQEERSGNKLKNTTYRSCLMSSAVAVMIVAAVLFLFFILAMTGKKSAATQINGILGGCCSVFMLSSPLGMATEIIKQKNAEPLQPVTVVFATLNSILWTLYGILTADIYVGLPNGLCTLACIFQAYLLVRYGRHPSAATEITIAVPPVPLDMV